MASSSKSTAGNPFFGVQVSEKLTKLNHAVWSAQVLATIRGARLEGYINGKIVAPAAEIQKKDGDKIVDEENPAYEEWFSTDQQVLGFLLSSLPRDILTQIASAKSAAEAWRAIGSMFGSQTRARSMNIRLALTTTQKGTLSITEYVGKMRALADEVASTGKPLDEEEIIAYIVNGLDGEYDSFVSSLGMRVEPISVACSTVEL